MALSDIDMTKKDLEAKRTQLMREIEQVREEQRLRIAAGARALNSREFQLKNLSAGLYKRTTKLDGLQKMPFTVGSVLVSSGKSVSSPQVDASIILDSAFVEVSANTPLHRRLNEIPRGSTRGLHLKTPEHYGLNGFYVGDSVTAPL